MARNRRRGELWGWPPADCMSRAYARRMSELHELDATDQAALVRDREVSAVELVRHHLDRIDRHGAALGAFITVTDELALEAAAAADVLIASGGAPPFAGVPTAI